MGVAFHGFLEKPDGYSPIAALTPTDLASGHLSKRLERYALELVHGVVGDRPLSVRVWPAIADVSAWAGRTPNGAVQVLVVNEQSRAVTIRLDPEQPGQVVSVTRLEGPSLSTAAVWLHQASALDGSMVQVGATGAVLVTADGVR